MPPVPKTYFSFETAVNLIYLQLFSFGSLYLKMELVNIVLIAIFIFPIFLNYVEATNCPSPHSHTGSTDDQICLRYVQKILEQHIFLFQEKAMLCESKIALNKPLK